MVLSKFIGGFGLAENKNSYLGGTSAFYTSAAIIYVEPGDSIQKAVNNARPGDTIIVKPGTYNGDIEISTANLTLISSSPHKTIIKAKNNAFNIYESNVVIKNQAFVFRLAAPNLPMELFTAQFKITGYLILV